MKSSRLPVGLLVDALLVAGCGDERPAAGNVSPSATGVSPSATGASASPGRADLPLSSITCASAQPTSHFRCSSNHDDLARLATAIGHEVGLPGTFDDVDANELGLLMERDFVDPAGETNGSPTMWEFHEFLCEHPGVRAVGFTANMGMERALGPTAIASLETVYADAIGDGLRRDARAFCATASEKTMRTDLECFWD